MRLNYFFSNDEDQLAKQAVPIQFDEDDHWWVGVQRCGATIALAAALSISATMADVSQAVTLDRQDDPAGQLHGQPDEDFWRNPTAPASASNYVALPFTVTEELPVAPPEEDLSSNPVRPISWLPPPLVFVDDDIAVPQPVVFQPDEDVWENSSPPAASKFGGIYLPDTEEIPAGSLFGPEEDLWINPVAPVPGSNRVILPLGDVEEIPASSLSGQPDEDFWQNQVRPAPCALACPNPWQFDQQENAAELFGEFDEDFWTNSVPPVTYAPPKSAFSGDDITVPQVATISTDEDFWINPVPPVRLLEQWPQQFSFDAQEAAGSLFEPEEEYAIPAQTWAQPRALLAFSDDDVAVQQPAPILDEDYWQSMVQPNLWPCFPCVFSDDAQVEKVPIIPVISFRGISVVYDTNVNSIVSGQDLKFSSSAATSVSAATDQSATDAGVNQVKADPNISTGGANTGLE